MSEPKPLPSTGEWGYVATREEWLEASEFMREVTLGQRAIGDHLTARVHAAIFFLERVNVDPLFPVISKENRT